MVARLLNQSKIPCVLDQKYENRSLTHTAANGGLPAKTIKNTCIQHQKHKHQKPTKTHIAMNVGLSVKPIKKSLHMAPTNSTKTNKRMQSNSGLSVKTRKQPCTSHTNTKEYTTIAAIATKCRKTKNHAHSGKHAEATTTPRSTDHHSQAQS